MKYKDLFISTVMDSEEYIGHSQAEVPFRMPLEVARKLCTVFEEELHSRYGVNLFVVAQYHSDGSGSLKALDFWKEGEHRMGHKDKNLLSWGNDEKV